MSSLFYCIFVFTFADNVLLFPEWEPNIFEESPACVGEYRVREMRHFVWDAGDGCPGFITVFKPRGAKGPRPTMVWVLGSNVQSHYHQSLHETLASCGYVVIVPDTRPLTFLPDSFYHARNVANADRAIHLALDGKLKVKVDPDRLAVGGYSIGGTMATFLAAENREVDEIVVWAPTGSPFWQGVDPDRLWRRVHQPTKYILGELDPIAPPNGFPAELQEAMDGSEATVQVIPQGTHLFFQQPTGADTAEDPETEITRFEQQGIAIECTLDYLNEKFGLECECEQEEPEEEEEPQ